MLSIPEASEAVDTVFAWIADVFYDESAVGATTKKP